jgi:hypothetical protein
MDPVMLVLIPGFVGGLVLAIVVVLSNRRERRASSVMIPYRPERVSTDVINMASIKVAGVGGLGLVAMAAAVALDVPHIGQSVAVGLGLGAIMAAIMIVRARRRGPMPSSGERMGANTMLSIDQPIDRGDDAYDGKTTLRRRLLASNG